MGGRGAKIGNFQNKQKANPYTLLKKTIKDASNRDLLTVYSRLKKKPYTNQTTEEKMVYAHVSDELLTRGKLLYDARTENFVRNRGKAENVFFSENNNRSYKIHGFFDVNHGEGPRKEAAKASYFFNGSWKEVTNQSLAVSIAEEYRRKKRKK